MIIKMNQLLNFSNVAILIKDAKLSLKTAYKLNKLLQSVENEKGLYQKTFADIINHYGKKDSHGNYVYTSDGESIEIIDDLREECIQKVSELENLDVEIADISFTVEELESLNLSVQEMSYLMPFIIE